MNKEFVKKMLQAKQFEYEAIKEILPDNLRKKVDTIENDAIELMKDITFDLLKDGVIGNFSKSEKEEYRASDHCDSAYKDRDGARCSADCLDNDEERFRGSSSTTGKINEKKKESRKINVDFM